MKTIKLIITTLTLSLLFTLSTALAEVDMGVTTHETRGYSDYERTIFIENIPAYTVVRLIEWDENSELITIDGETQYYVDPDDIWDAMAGFFEDTEYHDGTLKKGARIYQRPSMDSRSVENQVDADVRVCFIVDDWALINSFGENISCSLPGFIGPGVAAC